VALLCKTEGRAVGQFQWRGEVPSDQQERETYRRTRYRASNAPSQSTTNAGHRLEALDSPSSHQVQVEVEETPFCDQETSSADHEYENPELPYEDLDANTLINRESPPERPVYDELAH